ncbi:hypothetical protein P3C19_02620 [Bacteroides fragilis]|uniref:hypothetical protein n=1 Tax=Bacteroides fragilis TaxID=817 RepID=UPI0024DE4432|nr:hypothetical protein [Bacteroides fragilis]MDK2379061.1 hypothetical protein [Bacteroides fragilis]
MTLKTFIFKTKDRLWNDLIKLTHSTPIYPFIYRSYWHYLLHSKQSYAPTHDMYFAARPNPGAGIGHQMANWIAGYWWSKQLNLNFAHIPFSTSQWDDFLAYIIHSGFISGYQNRYGDNLKPPTNVYHRMTA